MLRLATPETRWRWAAACPVAAAALAPSVTGQEAVPGQVSVSSQATDEKLVAVFHSYTNLIQVPVLVLNSAHKPLPPIAESKFAISLDGGPPFRATHVRAEGEDPITLSVLLDATGEDLQLMPQVDAALKGLSRGFCVLATGFRFTCWAAR